MMEPIWRLDRRDSGHLFWRRDSGSLAPSRARVKFRCDVEVLEFWPREDDPSTDDDDCGDDDEEDERRLKEWRRRRSTPAATASNPVAVVAICLAAVVVTVSLPWLLVR